ncbi:hypothetical protein O181_044471 [Austropuccinia psidii MF-1]|uniref:Uncharacterized protein n=1 Tax=Austropuccinia psidii MF-1 TaxID=1389203 RepID=A0A9Q3DQG3_9BASI|nr:hypothetical protein [Austropuccinia psidii MF-1]
MLITLRPRDSSTPATPPWQSPILTLPHQHVILHTPYNAYTPAVPYRYVSSPACPCLPSPILTLLCLCILLSTLTMLMLLQCPLIFSINHPYDCTMFVFCPNP